MTKIPTTSPHKLSAERVAKVTKALVKRLIEKGVLPPPPAGTPPETPEPPRDEGKQRTIVLDCRPPSTYGAFRVIEGGKSITRQPAKAAAGQDSEDNRS